MRTAFHKQILASIFVFDVLEITTISAVLFLTVSIAVEKFNYSAMIVILLFLFSSLMTGRAILACLPNALPSSTLISAELLIGVAVLSAIMLSLCIMIKCSADVAFLFACGIGLIVAIFNAKRWTGSNVESKVSFRAIAVICVLSVIWSWQAIWAVPRLRETYVFPAWQDFFYHSCMITQFAHFSDLGGTWIFTHGTNLPVYHYASYLIPAAINAFSNLPALALATAFTEPFSFIVMGLGAWVLGVVIAGRAAGAASVAAILMLPDAAYYGFGNPYYDFHWLLQITPMGYAIGLSLLVLALGIVAVRQNSAAAFWLAAALTLITASFKMQLFTLLLLSGLVLVAIFWRPRRSWVRWACLVSLCVGGVALIGVAELLPRAPHLLSTTWEPRLVLQWLLPPGTISEKLPSAVAIPAGLAILLMTAFGGLIPVYFVGLVWCQKSKFRDSFDFVPLIFVSTYCFMVLSFPRNTGDEFQHRPFTLVYAVLAVWCACLVTRIVQARCPRHAHRGLMALGLVLLPFSFLLETSAQSGRAGWMKSAARIPVPRGLFQSAEYIRHNASISDVTLKSSDDGDVPLFGELTALSERASFILLLRSHFAWGLWGTPPDVVNAREAVSKELLRAQTLEEFSRIAQAVGISWYVLSPPDQLPEVITNKAVMSADGYFVLHVEPRLPSSEP